MPRGRPAGEPGREAGVLAALDGEGVTVCDSSLAEGRDPGQLPKSATPILGPEDAVEGVILHPV